MSFSNKPFRLDLDLLLDEDIEEVGTVRADRCKNLIHYLKKVN